MTEAAFLQQLDAEMSSLVPALQREFPNPYWAGPGEMWTVLLDAWKTEPDDLRPQNGDEVFAWAYATLFRAAVIHLIEIARPEVLRKIRRTAKGEAEEYVQEATLKIVSSLRRRPDGRYPRTEADAVPFLIRCAKNVEVDKRKSAKLRLTVPLIQDVTQPIKATSELLPKVSAAIAELAPERRVVVEMVLAGFKPGKIAELLDVAASNVYNLFKRAKEDLRRHLGVQHEG